jgi:hypothetical protein
MIDYRNSNLPGHIVTLEDPIEFYYTNKKSIITQRELGTDTSTFPLGLKYALRQDPDVLTQIRDQETICRHEAAETGPRCLHLAHHRLGPPSTAFSTPSRPTSARPCATSSPSAGVAQRLINARCPARGLPRDLTARRRSPTH